MAHLEAQTVVLRKMDVTLNGPEGQPEKGMPIRVDRLEQKQKWIWGALVASIAALGKAFFAIFRD
jgi:hypothetical protein